MAVKSKKVTGRRTLHFESFEEVLDDVHHLATVPHQQLGNWSLGEVCHHLAKGVEMATDESPARMPWLLRTIGPFLKKRIISRPMSPGFTAPSGAGLIATPEEAAVGIAALEKAIARFKECSDFKSHPVFGKMTRDEWYQFEMRHCELHLSFLVPE